MGKQVRQRHKETAMTVGTGLLINYPLNLLGLYVLMDGLGWTDPFYIGTTITVWMTVVAYTRVFLIRSYYDHIEEVRDNG